jgi:CHASE1-domain containing sensor protein
MGPFEMVVAIVAIGAIASIVKARYGITKDAKGNEIRVADNGETKQLLAEIRTLKERIQVLERIATDNNRALSLDAEIESLRDGAPR